jgi:hypothetical protein
MSSVEKGRKNKPHPERVNSAVPFIRFVHGMPEELTASSWHPRKEEFYRELTAELKKGNLKGEASWYKAAEYWHNHLSRNIQYSEVLQRCSDLMRRFKGVSNPLFTCSCMDGRMHGSKAIGFPPTSVLPTRTDGARLDLDHSNNDLYRCVDELITYAKKESSTPLCVFFGHRSETDPDHLGCAAFLNSDEAVLDNARSSAYKVKKLYNNRNVETVYAMTNTDDMSIDMYVPCSEGDIRISVTELIKEFDLKPGKVQGLLQNGFITEPAADPSVFERLGQATFKKLYRTISSKGKNGIYDNLEAQICLQTLLTEDIHATVSAGNFAESKAVHLPLMEKLMKLFEPATHLDAQTKATLMYMIIWNMSHTLYQKERYEHMSSDARRAYLGHSENHIAFGEGFELLGRNEALIVRPGMRDEREALKTARNVILSHSNKGSKEPLKVHINVEIERNSMTIHRVIREIHRRMRHVSVAMETQECLFLTSYSYAEEKIFYPVDAFDMTDRNYADEWLSYPVSVTKNQDEKSKVKQLLQNESVYKALISSSNRALQRDSAGI